MAALDGERLPTLESERARLRWLTLADAPSLFAIFSDPEVMRFWSTLPLAKLDEAEAMVEQIQAGFHAHRFYQWGIARKVDDAVIGTVSLYQVNQANRRAELGFALARAHWGQGWAREAVGAAIAFAFSEPLDLARLEADVDPDNHASLRLLERCGFQREGYMRERWRVGGGVQDSVMLGLLRREWP